MPRTSRRWGPGTSAVVRALVAADQPLTQVTLAALVGVTQPRVSQIVAMLAGHGTVRVTPGGYLGDRRRLVNLYRVRHAPALRSPESPWYSLESAAEAAAAAVRHAVARNVRVAVSADLAADLTVAWRHPTLTVIYSDGHLDLTQAGFVPAEGRVDATLLIRPTSDTTLLQAFEPWPRTADGIPLADPLQQIWDLHDLSGHDRLDHANRLTTAVLKRSRVP